jgi:hypothetical protein
LGDCAGLEIAARKLLIVPQAGAPGLTPTSPFAVDSLIRLAGHRRCRHAVASPDPPEP